METKLSKKIISVILAALLAFTAMPMTVFADIDDIDGVDESSNALKAAITAYENKMDGTTVYNKMYDAYTAYLAANEAYDAYVYGDKELNLTTYTDALNTAIANMTEFTDPVANATVASRDSDTAINSDYAKNLLYTEKQSVLCDDNASTTKNVRIQMTYSANTIALYDGNDIVIPVFCFWYYDQTGLSSRKMYALYPTDNATTGRGPADSSDFKLSEAWRGDNNVGTGDWNSAWNGSQRVGCYSASVDLTIQSTDANRAKWNRLANYMTYKGGSNGFSKGLKTVNPGWYSYTGYSSSSNLVDHYMTKVGTIYLVDYTSVKTAINNKKSMLKLGSSYTQGGMSVLLSAFQKATDAANNLSGVTPDTVASRAGDLASAANLLNTATVTPDVTKDADGNAYGYAALRKAIEDKRATYNSTASDKYENWEDFVTVYETARDIMANLLDTGYNDAAAAQTAAENLNNFVLKVNFTPADTSELVKVIDDAEVVVSNHGYFTDETYNAGNFEANIAQAKTDVWGSETAYKDAASTTGSENQAVVDSWEVTIGEAIMALQISKDAAVASAKGYSMNSAVAYAGTFNSADYSNYSSVTQAVSDCNNFIASITLREPGAVAAKINEYKELVENLIIAISNLQPAFSMLANGTVVNAGTTETTVVSYSHTSGAVTYDSSVTWERPSNQVFFRTTHDAAAFDIGTSNFTWYANRDYDQYLETLNFAALTTLQTGELSANANYSGAVSNYNGALSATALATGGNGVYSWKNFVVTSFTGANGESFTGKDLNGTGYLLSDNYDYTNDLLTAQNDYTSPCGGIICHKGSTYFSANGSLSLTSVTPKALSLTTLPTKTAYTVNNTLGYFQYYKYQPFTEWAGYAYAQNSYTQSATVIDISYYMDLIKTVDALNYLDYTASSWADLQDALTAAKADMDYGNMEVDDIITECSNRYTALYNAWKNLDTPLSNQVIKDAVANTTATYNASNKSNIYSADSWSAFETAFKAAYNSVYGSGLYTDANIRNIEANDDNTTAIAKVAQDLLDAYNALVKVADFSGLIAAAGTAITNYAYTVADLQAVADVINASSYLKYTEEQKAVTYEDEQDAIDAQTQTILDAINALTAKEPIDTTVLEAVKEEIEAAYDDPDAWDGIDAAKTFIDGYTDTEKLYSPVTVYNASVYGINYTQDDTDAIITEAETLVQPKRYDVTVVDETGAVQNYNSLPYGSTIEITSISGDSVDWYYSYKSNTSENAEKYYTTDSIIRFVVKGDTTLTTKPAANSDSTQYKVTIADSLYAKVISIDYVTAGASFTLPEAAPVAYYQFTGYTVNGETKQAGEQITPTANMTIVANYEASAEAETTITFLMNTATGVWMDTDFYANYNELIEITQAGLTTASAAKYASVTIAGESTNAPRNFRRSSASADIYAYVMVPYDYYDALFENIDTYVEVDTITGEKTYNAGDAVGIASIVGYGQDYSFYAGGDIIILPLSEEETNDFIAAGIVKTDENGADVSVRADLVLTDTKFSMVSTYALPEGAELVESGILFSKDQTADLTFNNVDSQTVYRLKSSQHTVGNQFVISIMNPSTTQNVKYLAYLIYEKDGVQYHIESDAVCATYQA